MRNSLLITSILFAAVACDRDSATSSRTGDRPAGPVATSDERDIDRDIDRSIDRTIDQGVNRDLDSNLGRPSTGTTNADPWSGPTRATGPSGGIGHSDVHAMTCTQLIPREVQRQYLANMTLAPTSHGTDIATSCRIEGRGVPAAATVQAWCNPDESEPQTDVQTSAKAAGKASILVDAGELQQLTAWDSDSSCQISLSVPKTVDAMALGRRILDGLPAKPVVGSRDEG